MKKSLVWLSVRALAYMLAIAGLAQLITQEGYGGLTPGSYGEQSLTEYLQALVALLSAFLFLTVAVIDRSLRPVAVMLAGLMFMMLIREADYLLDEYAFDGAWELLVALVLVSVSLYLWRQPGSITESIMSYAGQTSAGIMLGGLLTTLIFSRLFGQGSFWQAVMGESYMRVVKTIAEEGTELLGYGLICIAAVELLVATGAKSRRRAE